MDFNCREMAFLEQKIHAYTAPISSWDTTIKTYALNTFLPYMARKGKALELGCGKGYLTKQIAHHVRHLTVVEGSKMLANMVCHAAQDNVTCIHSLIENYLPDTRFDYIFAVYIMEHVSKPVAFLQHAGKLLNEDGLIFIVVPNAKALSRQLTYQMGLIDELHELTPNDFDHGHRRVYDRVTLDRDIELSGLQQVSQGGLMLKPFADFQMDLMIDRDILGETQLKGLYKLGLIYPDFAGSLFSICRLPAIANGSSPGEWQ